MYGDMLADVIIHAFKERVGKNQVHAPQPSALFVPFRTTIDYDVEEGYRFLDLMIFAPMNYVAVLSRPRWNVIALDDLIFEEDGDSYVKPGKAYDEGAGEWELLSYHDSGWRDAVRRFLTRHAEDIRGFSGLSDWYETVALDADAIDEVDRLVREQTTR